MQTVRFYFWGKQTRPHILAVVHFPSIRQGDEHRQRIWFVHGSECVVVHGLPFRPGVVKMDVPPHGQLNIRPSSGLSTAHDQDT